MSLKDASILSSNRYFVQQSRAVCAILVEQYEEHFCEDFKFGPVVQQEMLFKDIYIFSSGSGSYIIQRSRTVCEFLVDGLMRNISVKLF